MAEKTRDADPFDAAGKGFERLLGNWTELSAKRIAADGQMDVAQLLRTFKESLVRLARRIFDTLKDLISTLDPVGAAGALGTFVAAGVQELLDATNDVVQSLLDAIQVAAANSVAAVLGLIEAIKKSIYLILDRFVDPKLTAPITTMLDLVNNLIGNIAEIVSPEAGSKARRFRSDMYGQLYAIRRADAARRPTSQPFEDVPMVE